MKKICLSLLSFIMIIGAGYAQNVNIDSLKNVVANNPIDTLKIDAYIKLTSYYNNKNIDSSMLPAGVSFPVFF